MSAAKPRKLPIQSHTAGQDSKALAASEWRRQFFGEQRRRGNAFRDSLYLAMESRGLSQAKGWTREKKSPVNDDPIRILDIVRKNPGDGGIRVGVEAKLGGGEHQRLMNQVSNDLDAVEAGDERIWVHNDLGRLKDQRALEALTAIEHAYPDRFALVDASDPKSVAAFRQRMPWYQEIADSVPEARQVFQHYDAQYDARTARGEDFTIDDARRDWLQFEQTARFPELRDEGQKSSGAARFPELSDSPESGRADAQFGF